MNEFALDRDGNRIYAGDLVRCVISDYKSINRGEYRRVIAIRPYDCISLESALSPVGVSDYKARCFTLQQRAYPINVQKESHVLHIAIRIPDQSMGTIVEHINKFGLTGYDTNQIGSGVPIRMLVNTSADALKNEIRARIHRDNTERWLILSGNTIGEIAEQPVRFRSI